MGYGDLTKHGVHYHDTFCCGYCDHLVFDKKDGKRSEDKYTCLVRKDKDGNPLKVSLFKHDDIKPCYDKVRSSIHNDIWHRMWCEYIATIICLYVGLGVNSKEIETLRWFRTNIMEKDPEYSKLINDYQVLGKLIARRLDQELDAYNIANSYFVSYIKPVIKLIDKGRNEPQEKADVYYRKAIEIYSEMVKTLQNDFVNITIGDNYNNPDSANYTWEVNKKNK